MGPLAVVVVTFLAVGREGLETAEESALRLDRLDDLLRNMAAAGLTATHVLDHADDAIALVEALETRGELPLRLRFSPIVPAGASAQQLAEILAVQGRHGRRWSVEG